MSVLFWKMCIGTRVYAPFLLPGGQMDSVQRGKKTPLWVGDTHRKVASCCSVQMGWDSTWHTATFFSVPWVTRRGTGEKWTQERRKNDCGSEDPFIACPGKTLPPHSCLASSVLDFSSATATIWLPLLDLPLGKNQSIYCLIKKLYLTMCITLVC